MSSNIGIIVIFYNPTEDCVDHYLKLAFAGFQVAIGNNGMKEDFYNRLQGKENIFIVGEGANIGLASALNNCIKFCTNELHVSSVVLFDQDSKPKVDLPVQLENSFRYLQSIGNPACVGPHLVDRKMTGRTYSKSDKKYLKVDTIATSGTFISADVIKKVGMMMDGLFIDCIDHEWCFRASNLGFEIYVDQLNTMEHDMGENGINWFGKYKPVYRSPTRHYYIVRNTIYILKLKYIPFAWRLLESFKLIRRIVFYIFFSIAPIKTLRNVSQGVLDGLLGRLGAIH